MVAIAIDFKKAYDSIKRETMVQILKEFRIDSKIIDFIVRIYREVSAKIQLEKNKEIEIEVTSGIRQGCTASTVLFKLITYKIIEEMRKTEGIQILGPKITCLFYADDGLILAKDKEKAERSIEIIREIGLKYGLQLNERKSQCILFNTKEKYEKISNIEVVEEIKYLGVIVQAKRNVFEGQRNEIMKKKKIKRLSVMTNSVIEKSCHRVMMGKTYWKGVVLPSALYGAEVIDMKAEEIDKLQKAENTAMRRILKAPKWTAQAAIRGEIGIRNMKERIARSRLLYLRRIETGNNEVLKRILEDSKKHKKSKW